MKRAPLKQSNTSLATVFFVALGVAHAITANAADGAKETPAQLVDALHSAFGDHHVRAVHAKGIILEGKFIPAPEARKLSSAALFTVTSVPITVRFSDFTGIPDIPDTVDDANPRGLAIKFRLADGSESDIVSHSFNGCPTANSDEFAELLRAIGKSGPNATKPTTLDSFLASHPIAKTFLTTQKPAPVSYATLSYFGVNSFSYVDSEGKKTFVRYRFVPKAGEQFLNAGDLKAKGPNYLKEEIATRVTAQPIQFDWYAQISGPGDVIENPAIAWPASRKLVKLGTLTVDSMAREQAKMDKALIFLPARVPSGIQAADPMIGLRNAAYPISFGGRQ